MQKLSANSFEAWYKPSYKNPSGELWSDKFAPLDVKEVALHHDKLRDVSDSLTKARAALGGILLLTGPPGCSKSTVVHLLCRSLGLPVLQWQESEELTSGPDEIQSFENFLLGSIRYAGLNFLSTSKPDSHACGQRVQVLLFEHLPLGLCDQPRRFQQQLRNFLSLSVCPTILVFVLTKSHSTSSCSTCDFDSTTLNRLFPPSLKEELQIAHVDFNPVAASIMTKALTRVANLASAEFQFPAPPRQFIQRLAASSAGDLRLALNNLQFLMTRGVTKNGNFAFISSSPSLDSHERDSGLQLFHALGKILYAKRCDDSPCPEKSFLPKHLHHWKRPPLSFIPEVVLNQCSLSGDDVIAWLHENFPLFFDLEAMVMITQNLTFADAYLTGGMNWRLGLTPAADRNADSGKTGGNNHAAAAGDHYAAMCVVRAIILATRSVSPGAASKTFRTLKSPQSRQLMWASLDARSVVLQQTTSQHQLVSHSAATGSRLQSILVAGLREALLDRFPAELKIPNSSLSSDVESLKSLCLFTVGQQTMHTKPPFTRSANHREQDYVSVYCPPDAAVEGNALPIEEDFSDSESPR
uniref:Cell cycle checkpoint protein RAD17 n=2 Tax=Schistocephalus solidus TaxID=70667 RepID=A0A0X3PVF6_SCHSO